MGELTNSNVLFNGEGIVVNYYVFYAMSGRILKMKPKTVDAIKDLATQYENKDLEVAFELMRLAYEERPNGPWIKKKYLQYQQHLNKIHEDQLKFRELLSNANAAIIPIGFRCFTTEMISEKLGVKKQMSLPFDSGFFPPHAVASVLANPKISMEFDDQGETHSICVKNEANKDANWGIGIKFTSSTYKHINSVAVKKDMPKINNYLDSSFGFYTLDKKHKFVLAHYNWHHFADVSRSKGITNPKENLNIINNMLNRRIDRMMEICDKANHIFFIFGENQNYKYMQIDEEYFFLNDFEKLNQVCNRSFGSKFTVCNIFDIPSASNIFKELHIKPMKLSQGANDFLKVIRNES